MGGVSATEPEEAGKRIDAEAAAALVQPSMRLGN